MQFLQLLAVATLAFVAVAAEQQHELPETVQGKSLAKINAICSAPDKTAEIADKCASPDLFAKRAVRGLETRACNYSERDVTIVFPIGPPIVVRQNRCEVCNQEEFTCKVCNSGSGDAATDLVYCAAWYGLVLS